MNCARPVVEGDTRHGADAELDGGRAAAVEAIRTAAALRAIPVGDDVADRPIFPLKRSCDEPATVISGA